MDSFPCAHLVAASIGQIMMGVIPYKTNNSWRKRQVHPPLSWEGLLAYAGESSELHVQVPITQVMNMVIEAHLASYVSRV